MGPEENDLGITIIGKTLGIQIKVSNLGKPPSPPSSSITLLQEHVNPNVTFPLISLHILLFVTRMQLFSWLFKSFIAGNYSYWSMKTIIKVKNLERTSKKFDIFSINTES